MASGTFTVVPREDGGELHAFHVPPDAIVGMTIGLRATKKDLAGLKALGPDIRYGRATLDEPIYAVKVVDA